MDHFKIQHNPTFMYPYRLYEKSFGQWGAIMNCATLQGAKRAMIYRELAIIQNMVSRLDKG